LLGGEQVAAGLGVGQVVVHVGAAAGPVGERLGHEGGDGPIRTGGLGGQHFEEDEAVGRRQGVGVLEVDFVLGVGIFVVGLVDPPAKLAQRLVHVDEVI